MSTIQKVAVYDARMQQDEPVYAVQKGALSVSVAPFASISASAAQMTFQVLVPSLNVFVDRKLQISTGLNFSANLFYGGPRAASMRGVVTAGGTAWATSGITLTLTGNPSINGVVASGQQLVGANLYSTVAAAPLPFNTTIIGVGTAAFTWICNCSLPSVSTAVGTINTLIIELPWVFDVPDPVAGVTGPDYDSPFSGALRTAAYQPLGYALAVSPKDLAYCAFPLQSSLTNMTATLNDCTVTTNGDTLREQLCLTNVPENTKQRTTPTNLDVYSWGRDDANSDSGNFSSYSVVDSVGDIPNGAYPTTWYADASSALPLSSATRVIATLAPGSAAGNGATATYPFQAPGLFSFNMGVSGTFSNLQTASGGVGFYIAPTNASNVAGFAAQNVIVPFVNNQPVWTTGFPGGDLTCLYTSATAGTTSDVLTNGNTGFRVFSTTDGASQVLQLLKDVPPYCMIGAKLYAQRNTLAQGSPLPASSILGYVCNILSGALGATGSSYNICTSSAAAGAFTPAVVASLALQAGFSAATPMPVFGQVSIVEPLIISPLIWADSAEFQTVGLYGMTNMQFILNFAPLGTCYAAANPSVLYKDSNGVSLPAWVDDLTRPTQNTGNILRSSNIRSVISDLTFSNQAALNGPWTNPTLYATFLTPGPDVTLPLVSTVPYVEFPRYVQTITGSIAQSAASGIRTQTISLTSIPDMVMIYVKPATKGPSQLDQYIPISNVSVTFDNFSNLCSGFQQFNLYESAVAAGLDIDWHQWRGYSQSAVASTFRVSAATNAVTTAPVFRQAGVTQLSGGPILLRMGQDITLSPGLAPGCLGNYSFQATLTLSNPYGFYDYLQAVTVTVIAINTGFFETVRGQSAIRKTILNSADVESATPDSGMSRTHLNRMVGRGAYMRGGSYFPMFSGHMKRGMGMGGMSHAAAAAGRHAGMKRGSGL
jgi:hypothetical protein